MKGQRHTQGCIALHAMLKHTLGHVLVVVLGGLFARLEGGHSELCDIGHFAHLEQYLLLDGRVVRDVGDWQSVEGSCLHCVIWGMQGEVKVRMCKT